MQKIKVGDEVQVLCGKSVGSRGKVLEINRKKNTVIVEGVNLVNRHLKPNRSAANPRGGIVEKPGPIHVSNVMLVVNETPTRVGVRELEDGRRVRVSIATQQMIDQD